MRLELDILADVKCLASADHVDWDAISKLLDEGWPVRTWAMIPVILSALDRSFSWSVPDEIWNPLFVRLQDFSGWECFLLESDNTFREVKRRLSPEIPLYLRELLLDRNRRDSLLTYINESAFSAAVTEQLPRHAKTPMVRDNFLCATLPHEVDAQQCRRIELTLVQALRHTKVGEMWGGSLHSFYQRVADLLQGFKVIASCISFTGAPAGSTIWLGRNDEEPQRFTELVSFVLEDEEWQTTTP